MSTGRSMGVCRMAGLCLILGAGAARAQESTSVKIPWKLDFTSHRFGVMQVADAKGDATLHWYVLFTVKNTTSEAVPLNLAFRLDTDTKKSFLEGFYPKAKTAIETGFGKPLVGLNDRPKTLAAGQSVDGVAIFSGVDRLAARYDVVVGGLRDVVSVEAGKAYLDKKVLVLSYAQPSDEFDKMRARIRPLREEWKTEGEKKEIQG